MCTGALLHLFTTVLSVDNELQTLNKCDYVDNELQTLNECDYVSSLVLDGQLCCVPRPDKSLCKMMRLCNIGSVGSWQEGRGT